MVLSWTPNMPKLTTLVAIAAVSFCSQAYAAVTDGPPRFDFRKSCHVDTQAYPGGGDNAACLTDEKEAQKAVVSQWTQFEPASRGRCLRMVTSIAGAESYVELLTCLQVAKEAKSLPKM
jgi:hypothetical protein